MTDTTTQLYVIRHGETEWNIEGRIQGHANSALTATGIAQAQALGEHLQHHTFSAFYSSDLDRAYHTAQAIAAKHTQSIQLEPLLREKCLGVFEGLLRAEMQTQYPTEYQQYKFNHADYVIPGGGESGQQFLQRCIDCFNRLVQNHRGETVAVVTHGGVITNLFKYVVGLPVAAPRRFQALNTSVNRFTYDHQDASWFLDSWGEVSHLAKTVQSNPYALDVA